MTDEEVIAALTAKIEAADYNRVVVPASAICAQWDLTPSTISNWVRRSERTGVRRYAGGYDPNEILRWLVMRGQRARRGDRCA